ncbi:MAG TPA: helicase C-terminal domain-containing protein, partial [Planctomycetota bacterium]|nr:helicase C-terminal domain-containing protein [Planctomycetota bacterium]
KPRCCSEASDRMRCGAWVARRRAERSHVVVTNHAFVLLDPRFFQNLIADECDHLHAQAKSAASVELSLRRVRDDVDHVAAEGAASRGLLAALERELGGGFAEPSAPLAAALRSARGASGAARDALRRLERCAAIYASFAAERRRETGEDSPSSFLLFATSSASAPELLDARVALAAALSELSGACETIPSLLPGDAIPGAKRFATRFQQSAMDLAETAEEVEAWLPVRNGALAFDPSSFHDLETDGPRGHAIGRRTLLLPNEWLGRRYFPGLQSVVLVSASNWLRRGFDLARAYLGLDLLEEGSEERPPRAVATYRSPPTFDYSRVLLAVPSDVPQARFGDAESRAPFDRYLVDFLRFLVERTRGRTLALLTNLQQCRSVGRALAPFFRERRIPFLWQGMEGRAKEELPRLFRSADGGLLMGVDTFWYGVDFPGDLLEFLVVAKLPFGSLDRYMRAQRAALGQSEHHRRIYLPEALAMFRQGCGRLMRRETDRGAVFLLDPRVLQRWRLFLDELPGRDPDLDDDRRLVEMTGPTEECVRAALAHCGRLEECRRLGLDLRFAPAAADRARSTFDE